MATGFDSNSAGAPEEATVFPRDGRRRSAIALMMLGPDIAAEILRELSDEEMEGLLRTAADIKAVSPEEVVDVLDEFGRVVGGEGMLVMRPAAFVRSLAEETFGSDRVKHLLGEVPPPPRPEPELEPVFTAEEASCPLPSAVQAPPEALATILKKEHPQTIAVALAVLPTSKASAVIQRLPEAIRAEVVRRIATTGNIAPDLLKELDETLKRELEMLNKASLIVDGQGLVVSLLKAMPSDVEEGIFKGLKADDPELSDTIKKKMFVFEDLLGIDSRSLQNILKEVDGKSLTIALKGGSTALREHILSVMSSRAATMILEDLESMGAVAVATLTQAQDDIVNIALRLAAEGKIIIRGGP